MVLCQAVFLAAVRLPLLPLHLNLKLPKSLSDHLLLIGTQQQALLIMLASLVDLWSLPALNLVLSGCGHDCVLCTGKMSVHIFVVKCICTLLYSIMTNNSSRVVLSPS